MLRLLPTLMILVIPAASFGQDWFQPKSSDVTRIGAGPHFLHPTIDPLEAESLVPSRTSHEPGSATEGILTGYNTFGISRWDDEVVTSRESQVHRSAQIVPNYFQPAFDFAPSGELVIRGQSPSSGESGGSGGGGAGAAAATDPSVPLTQLQFQNLFTPESYDASGYSNTFIVQPVIPLNIGEDAFFPYHIIRPTIPIIAPTADPDGPRGVHGGLGDTTIVDVFIHPSEALKTNFGVGYVGILPTRTHPALGRGEWQLGPSAVVISRAIPKWIIGGLVEVPFSLDSDAYAVQMQGIALRLLPNEWFVGWGDQIIKFDDQNGGYDIPLSLQLGKVVKIGGTPMKLFLEPIYTPEGLRSGPGGTEWAIKLNLTILFPEAKFDAPLLGGLGGGRCCR